MMKFFRRQASQPAAKPGEKPAAPRRMGPPKFTPEQQAEIDKYQQKYFDLLEKTSSKK